MKKTVRITPMKFKGHDGVLVQTPFSLDFVTTLKATRWGFDSLHRPSHGAHSMTPRTLLDEIEEALERAAIWASIAQREPEVVDWEVAESGLRTALTTLRKLKAEARKIGTVWQNGVETQVVQVLLPLTTEDET